MDPASASDVDAAWLSGALGEAVAIRGVTDVGAGVGLLANVARVELTDGRRLIVKMPSTDDRARNIAHQFGYYAREAGAYRYLLGDAPIPTPRCYAIVDAARGPVLVLEDLTTHVGADQLDGATPAHASAAADLLGDLHAAFWNHPVLATCSWLPGPTDAVVTMYDQLFAMTWEPFCAQVEGLVPDAHLRAAEAVIVHFAGICAEFAHAPRTLVHGDFRLDNLLFAADGTAAAIDWQLAAWGRGAYDLAFFASGSVDDVALAEIEESLLVRYHERLVTKGVTGYDLETCRHDYRLGLVMNLPNPVTALVAVPPGNERGARLLRENARRALATIARHEASLSSR
jgi:aminoglycoside/choline kinase family phosphotransferase